MSKFEMVVEDGGEHAHFVAGTPEAVLEFLSQFLPKMTNATVQIRSVTENTTDLREAFEAAVRQVQEIVPETRPVKVEVRPSQYAAMHAALLGCSGVLAPGDLTSVEIAGMTFLGVPLHVAANLAVGARVHMSNGTTVDLEDGQPATQPT